MSQIVIGKSGARNVSIDSKLLMTTRLLITSDSGGGKTWLLKRLIEQAFGSVGIIVIDPEGEFAPLRTKFDFFLVGKGGDTPADIRTAEKVARTLLTGRASAVCDIYEMNASERHVWVKRFLDALLDAPKELRHPYFVIVDESHMFCPEHGKGESEAADAMRGLATRGRKRMLCGIYATQRLATLSKDLTGMCLNRLVGPTFESINQQRAALELGIPKGAEQTKFFASVKMLEPGYFYALGRAVTKDLELVHIGPIETPHGHEALKYELKPPPPTEKVREWLAKLGDLPKQAEEEARTVADFKKQIRELKVQLRTAPTAAKEVMVADPKAIERERTLRQTLRMYEGVITKLRSSLSRIAEQSSGSLKIAYPDVPIARVSGREIQKREASANSGTVLEAKSEFSPQPRPKIFHDQSSSNGDFKLPIGERKILIAAAQYPEGVERNQLSILSGYRRSSRDAYLARLKAKNFIDDRGGRIVATQDGVDALGSSFESLPEGEELQRYWLHRLPVGEKKIFEILLANEGQPVPREGLDEATNYKRSSRDAYLARMIAKKIVEQVGRGQVKAAEMLFQ